MNCIIVDDEPIARRGMKRLVDTEPRLKLLAMFGSAEDALDYFSENDVVLVFMDIQMPGLDGIEATRRIRAFLPDIPIIAMTAHTMKGDAERCLAAGMQDHVAKPIDPPGLFAPLRKWLKMCR